MGYLSCCVAWQQGARGDDFHKMNKIYSAKTPQLEHSVKPLRVV